MKQLIVLFAFFSVIVGLYSFSYQNNVLADSLYPCCNRSLCSGYPDELSPTCSTISSVLYAPDGCAELNVSCRICVDWTKSGCICGGGTDNCREDDGTLYYGRYVICNSHTE